MTDDQRTALLLFIIDEPNVLFNIIPELRFSICFLNTISAFLQHSIFYKGNFTFDAIFKLNDFTFDDSLKQKSDFNSDYRH